MDRVRIRRREEEEQRLPFAFHSGWPYVSFGFGDEQDYLIENLSLLIAGGLGVSSALAAIKPALKKNYLKSTVNKVEEYILAGVPLWRAFEMTKLFPRRIVAVIKAGEESGRLPEHLNLVSIQQHKERVFASRVRSALLYPGIILIVALVVGIGSAWYTLPKITSVLESSATALPWSTQLLISFGNFIGTQGWWSIPLFWLVLVCLGYVLFIGRRTKIIGEYLILKIPGIKRLLQGVEVARFGFLFGAMLQAGIVVTDALQSVIEGTPFNVYKRFYEYIQDGVTNGQTLEALMNSYKKSDKLIPLPMQQLIIASEKSGKLPETLLKIGLIFEEKTESMTKDLATVLEPIVLLFVAVIVGIIVLAIVSPIYTLVNSIS